MKKFFFGIVFISINAAAVAGTKWSVSNHTNHDIIIQCQSEKDHLRSFSIETPHLEIKAKSSYEHNWGDRFYNDGQGLNPGTWQCSVGKTTQTLKAAGTFHSSWGEDLRIAINQSSQKYLVTKIESESRISRSSSRSPQP